MKMGNKPKYSQAVRDVLKRQIKKQGECCGELDRVYSAEDYKVLVFTDGRWALLGARENGLEGAYVEFCDYVPKEDVLLHAMLITREEFDENYRYQHEAWAKMERHAEIYKLQELVRKYPNEFKRLVRELAERDSADKS